MHPESQTNRLWVLETCEDGKALVDDLAPKKGLSGEETAAKASLKRNCSKQSRSTVGRGGVGVGDQMNNSF